MSGKLVQNIVYFARALRGAGLPIGPGKVIEAVTAVQTLGIQNRADFYWTLHAVLLNRRDQHELFDQAFHIFWRNPRLLEQLLAAQIPQPENNQPAPEAGEPLARRLADALQFEQKNIRAEQQQKHQVDAGLTWSDRELLQQQDFEKMSVDELAQAKVILKQLHLTLATVATRRFRPTKSGQTVDLRTTLRHSIRAGSDNILMYHKSRRQRPPALVLLCDISGSMSRYSRMLLHFAHALSNDRNRYSVHTFVFGTRLTNITRQLRFKDVDLALDKVTHAVQDWSGGTCIGQCLHVFNRDWSRRVLAQGAVVLFISDGLDRDDHEYLQKEMQRLHKSCRRLIWLNPLLRYTEFTPKARGIRAILPHVDEFRTAHNIDSLIDLSKILSATKPQAKYEVRQWQQQL